MSPAQYLIMLQGGSTRLVLSAEFIAKRKAETRNKSEQSPQCQNIRQTQTDNTTYKNPHLPANAVNTALATITDIQKPTPPEPKSLKQALSSPDAGAWAAAWDAQLNRHDQKLRTWYYDGPLPKKAKTYVMTFRAKTKSAGRTRKTRNQVRNRRRPHVPGRSLRKHARGVGHAVPGRSSPSSHRCRRTGIRI